MHTRAVTRTILLAAISMLFVSCTSNSYSPSSTGNQQAAEKSTSQSNSDPCSLPMNEEVAAVLKESLAGNRGESFRRPNCRYNLETGQLVVFLFTDESAKGGFNIGKSAYDANTQAVNRVGYDAYWSSSIKKLNVLTVDAYFTIPFLGGSPGSLEQATELAQRAVSRLS